MQFEGSLRPDGSVSAHLWTQEKLAQTGGWVDGEIEVSTRGPRGPKNGTVPQNRKSLYIASSDKSILKGETPKIRWKLIKERKIGIVKLVLNNREDIVLQMWSKLAVLAIFDIDYWISHQMLADNTAKIILLCSDDHLDDKGETPKTKCKLT